MRTRVHYFPAPVAPRLLLDPTADATSLSELSTSSVAVTPLPAPKIDARKKTAAAAARLARPEAESNLILETTECGLRRHYLIPRHLQKAARRKRSEREKTSSSASAASLLSKHLIKSLKGTKLHLAMEHIFVATNVKRCEKAIFSQIITLPHHKSLSMSGQCATLTSCFQWCDMRHLLSKDSSTLRLGQ